MSFTTWNTLGLGIGAAYAGLCVVAVTKPKLADDLFGITHKADTLDEKSTAGDAAAALVGKTDFTSVNTLLGGRDLAIGVAIVWLGSEGKNKEMGTVILSTLCLCIPDVWLAYRAKKHPE